LNDAVQRPVVAVDAMGGDLGPEAIIPGTLKALAADTSFSIALYGDPAPIGAQLAQHDHDAQRVEIVPCSQDIGMGESPAAAIRGKPDSPIVRAMVDQKAGRVQAVVSAGSTGAMVATSLVILGRLASVDRPAIGAVVPTIGGEMLLLDAGANVQCSAEHLVCFARMGELYAREMLEVELPTVALLNIGEEQKKGTELAIEAHRMLRESGVNFSGNVEGNVLLLDAANVVVTDGYTGNIVLKLIEGFGHFMGELAHVPDLDEAHRQAIRPILELLMKKYSYEVYGGALLLGIDGVSIIAHGRSSSRAITSAVRVAHRQVRLGIPAKLQSMLGG
jgi:glycerol-3-phosphate acyltransferase PlsX